MSTRIESDQVESGPRYTLEGALLALLNRDAYTRAQWAKLKEQSATADDIHITLTQLFGFNGVSNSQAGIIHLRGGKEPGAWFGSYDTNRAPDLTGQALIDKVREVLEIPLTEFEETLRAKVDNILDLVPDDPHGRGWDSLSDIELQEWKTKLKGKKKRSELEAKRLDMVTAEISIRAKTEELREELESASLSDLESALELYKDEPRLVWVVEEEIKSRGMETQRAETEALQPVALFDYDTLDRELADELHDHAREINYRIGRASGDIIEIGKRLMLAKQRLDYQRFLEWTSAEFGMKERSTRNFIYVAQVFGEQQDEMPPIPQKALYLLASPSTPKEAREEVVTRARAGETITHETTRRVVERHKVERETRRPKQVDLIETAPPQADAAEAVAIDVKSGTCRVCDCTQDRACVIGDDGETCGWAAGENKTLCTSCRDIMASRGWSEETTRGRLQNMTAGIYDIETGTNELEEATDEETFGAETVATFPNVWLQKEFTDQALIITLQILPGSGPTRVALVSAGVQGVAPVVRTATLDDLWGLNGGPAYEALNALRAELPARLEAKKQAEVKAKPASDAKSSARKPATKKPAPAKKSTTKGASK
ncbi:MAG: DUF3102 domain-containing protein [Blastocatellia bacterium]|nr:DUF3102 domain-containing protein [Blastocatellia bacterium]